RFVLDGELTVAIDGRPDFDALQMRLHPAQSRIDKLSRQTPAELTAFDLLADAAGRSLMDRPLGERRAALEAFAKAAGPSEFFRLSPGVENLAQAARWLDASGGETDGVVAKRLDEPYQPGERAMLKVKRLRTADCVV